MQKLQFQSVSKKSRAISSFFTEKDQKEFLVKWNYKFTWKKLENMEEKDESVFQ